MRAPLCFGIISDIQYADIEPASNFGGSEHREYRGSAQAAHSALDDMFKCASQVSFIAQLGDLVDGQNAGEYGQGLALSAPQSESAINQTLRIWDKYNTVVYHTIGNHELYNFTWDRLQEHLNGQRGECHHHLFSPNAYGSFSPQPGWKAIVLNSYELNVIKPRDEETRAFTEDLLTRMNPNYGQTPPFNFFEGLSKERLRYVPFNGGFGRSQLEWVTDELKEAALADEKCLIFSHLPIYAPAASEKNVAFDADELLERLGEYEEQVSAYFAGHRHSGGAAVDAFGIPHITVQSPLTHGKCAAIVRVDEVSLRIEGIGAHRSYEFKI